MSMFKASNFPGCPCIVRQSFVKTVSLNMGSRYGFDICILLSWPTVSLSSSLNSHLASCAAERVVAVSSKRSSAYRHWLGEAAPDVTWLCRGVMIRDLGVEINDFAILGIQLDLKSQATEYMFSVICLLFDIWKPALQDL